MATKTFDLSKLRKSLTKSIPGISSGFNDPSIWISTGSYVLNYLISGRFDRGVPLGKVTVVGGQPGSGKSYLVSGNIIKNAQDQGILVVLIDSESALDEEWLKPLKVDTDESKLLKLNMAMIDDAAKTISDTMKNYKTLPDEERPYLLFVIDSLGMMLTATDQKQFEDGELKGDKGIKAKALTALIRNCVNMFGEYNVGLVATNHSYESQDMFNPDDKITGGCLTEGHQIIMDDDSLKNIENILIGDVVKTTTGSGIVQQTFVYDDKEVFELSLSNGDIITATGEHKFLVEFDDKFLWKTVNELNENDEILIMDVS